MPPKKAKKGKAKAAPQPVIVNGTNIQDMTKEQLEIHIGQLHEELDRERQERSYFLLDRDKVNVFWEITKRQLEEKKAELRNKDRELEEAEERHQTEIKVYKQKVKHLLYEHQNNISGLKAENMVGLNLMKEEYDNTEKGLIGEKSEIKRKTREAELSYEDVIKNLKLSRDESEAQMKDKFDEEIDKLEAKYTKKLKIQREEMDIIRKNEINQVEERKNTQITVLMKNHEKAFSDIKNYYNDITLNNLALINTLKDEMEKMKKKEDRLDKQMAEILSENKRLHEPLQKAKEELDELHKQLKSYNKDKEALKNTKKQLKQLVEDHQSLQYKYEVMEQRFVIVVDERDSLYKNFTNAIEEVRQKSGLKNLMLNKKLEAIQAALEKKDAQLAEVLSASNLDPSTVNTVLTKLEDILDSKNRTIKDLHSQLAKICKAHSDLSNAYEAKLELFGIRSDDVGFKPIKDFVANKNLGKGPAGLVSKPT